MIRPWGADNRGLRALDALNFLLADVRGALGPYLNVYLVTEQHWTREAVGWATSVGGLAALSFQAPAGAVVDATHAKRALVILLLVVTGAGALVIYAWPTFWPVLLANSAIAFTGDFLGPAVTAITLGLVTRDRLARRLGRNSAFDHAGNIVIAAIAGAVGYAVSQRAVFLLVPIFAGLAIAAVAAIPAAAIDHRRARGLDGAVETRAGDPKPSGWRVLIDNRPLLVFAVCAALFHFANAPLLPLVGQKLALAHTSTATAMMSACIIAAQFVMLPMAILVGHTADRWGRKPLLLAAYAILPIRAVLYTLSDNSAWLIGVQLLDGIGAGIFGAVAPRLIADLTRGTGRFNVARGAVATVQGIGVSISALVTGRIVDLSGYAAGFLTLGAAAAVALMALLLLMPETAPIAPPARLAAVEIG